MMASTTATAQEKTEKEVPLLPVQTKEDEKPSLEEDINQSLVDSFHLDNTLFDPAESSSDMDLTMTLTDTKQLKKNLVDTFEQTVHAKRDVESEIAPSQHENCAQEGGTMANRNVDSSSKETVSAPPDSKRAMNASLSVFLRLRPAADSTIEILPTANDHEEPTRVRAIPPVESNAYKSWRGPVGDPTNLLTAKEYSFTGVFGSHSPQAKVYEAAVHPLVTGVVQQASSALVFCYGITNAGKTHTVTGPEKALHLGAPPALHQSWGLVPRALKDLVTCVHERSASLILSSFEIYNEQVFDLLQNGGNTTTATTTLAMPNKVSDTNHGILRGVSSHSVTNLEEGFAMLALAQRSRRSATNRINRDSSRSHAVCQFRVINSDESTADLWMVDLAGSERTKRTGGNRLQEASSINMSLMTLNRCLTALRENQDSKSATMIPYRESKLTQLFAQHWMSASAARTTMIVNVNPTATDFDETQHVLAYATAAKTIRMAAPSQKTGASQRPASEYDYDGRRKKKTMVQKVSKMIQKLSPKRAGKRKATEKDVPMKKARIEDETGQTVVVQQSEVARQAELAALVESERQTLEDQIRADISLEMEAEREAIENQVRTEVAIEMEEQMSVMREQYQSIIEHLKEQLHQASDERQLQAVEQDMQRMRQEHMRAKTKWEQQHKVALKEKDDELAALRQQLEEASKSKETTDDDEERDSDTSTVLDEDENRGPSERNEEDALLLFPSKVPKRDRQTGTYVRPRGRAPQGVERWDENRGAWRRSILE